MQQKCLFSPEVGDMMEIAFSRVENKQEIKGNIQSGVIRARDRKRQRVHLRSLFEELFYISFLGTSREQRLFCVPSLILDLVK